MTTTMSECENAKMSLFLRSRNSSLELILLEPSRSKHTNMHVPAAFFGVIIEREFVFAPLRAMECASQVSSDSTPNSSVKTNSEAFES